MVQDNRFGQVCATLANLQRDPDKKPEEYTPAFFFSSLRDGDEVDEQNEQTVEEQIAVVEALNALFGGVDLRKKNRDQE